MLLTHGLRRTPGVLSKATICRQFCRRRRIAYDGRNRLSDFWTPTQRAASVEGQIEGGHDLLVRAGFLRQAHSGIFHLLPLGLRVQDKIERLIDKHMRSIGASKVSLSSISSEELWRRSGRLDQGRTSELFQFEDRKGASYLLSPTHEEEITSIVADAVHSYKDLPLRLYQVSRKYRDELRPRQGLLRGREFVMKDLYTFDADPESSDRTYEEVRKAYAAFLDELDLPYLTARADSGNMGGTLSHEYHFASPHGEDTIIQCDRCDYSINEELYVGTYKPDLHPRVKLFETSSAAYISDNGKTLCVLFYPANAGEPNPLAAKSLCSDLRPTAVDSQEWRERDGISKIVLRDPRIDTTDETYPETWDHSTRELCNHSQPVDSPDGPLLLTKATSGHPCPNCEAGRLILRTAVEIGHTFHLGQRYSLPLSAQVTNSSNNLIPIEMGCHGIGVSRLIAATSSILADGRGLNWPFAIAPFQVLVVPLAGTDGGELGKVYDGLSGAGLDVAIDDRERPMGWRLNDADLVGYPFIVVLGKGFRRKGEAEVQCRRLGVKEKLGGEGLVDRVRELRGQLDGLNQRKPGG